MLIMDRSVYVDRDERRYGPFYPVDGPIPLHRYRKFKKTRTQERADLHYSTLKGLKRLIEMVEDSGVNSGRNG
jgi:hypothetical protein